MDATGSPDRDGFVARYGHIFEHSPWVVERAWDLRPFADTAALHAAFMIVLRDAGAGAQLALFRAHPELGAKVALTDDSAAEQKGAGLRQLTEAEYRHFTALNAAYREKFGFPFIVCVRQHDKASILAAFESRLGNNPVQEHAQAFAEISAITELRLNDLA